MINIRIAEINDIEKILPVIESGRAFLESQGLSQWQNGYDPSRHLEEDIAKKWGYVLLSQEGIICGYAALIDGIDECYENIKDGFWYNSYEKYISIHSVAIDNAFRGKGLSVPFLHGLTEIAEGLGYRDIRIDTHPLNEIMQKVISRTGFVYRGMVEFNIPDGKRKAYQLIKIENQLEQIAKSYDRHFIEYGMEDSLAYDNLPEYIKSNPNYTYWVNECISDTEDNSRIKLIDYLSPAENMNFIQLGCSMNLKTKGYDKWRSVYHGVDISSETIQTLNEYVTKNNISVGALHCGSVHETPFADSYFDIGECIGVLEYYQKDFVLQAIKEFYRILKPDGKFVLDIPNIQSRSGKMMMEIEEYMGRPDRFDILPREFEDMIQPYFEVVENFGEHHTGMMYFYCLKCKK
jgi:Methylase involved in ubiquinone/menaquinone biosynthesis